VISKLRAGFGRLFTPLAKALLRVGLTPDAITVLGTLGVMASALWLFPTGHLLAGALACWFFAMSDAVDGLMARISGRQGPWGAFLDSTLDRFADGAIFAGLIIWLAGPGEDQVGALLGLACLVLGGIVPYARARAEGIGLTANVGIAERGDRLVVALTAAGVVGIGAPGIVLTIALGVLAAASLVTVGQRIAVVRRQLRAAQG
jgi:CDP-diacylglycerol--glycerol-3-phosphate 3-phosphatidyltransferase